MSNRIILIIAALVLVAAQASVAQSSKTPEAYGGVALGFIELVDEVFPPQEFSLVVVHGRIGTRFNNYFSSELRVGFGLSEGTDTLPGYEDIEITAQLNHVIGVYGLMHVPLDAPLTPYALFGYSRSKVQFSGADEEWTIGIVAPSIGVGVNWKLGTGNQLNAEYKVYFNEDDLDLGGFSIGLVFAL